MNMSRLLARQRDLEAIECFIDNLLNDDSHPIHNCWHPLHAEYVNAVIDLVEKAEAMRKRLSDDSVMRAA